MELFLHPKFEGNKNVPALAEFLKTQSPPHCLSGMTAIPMWNIRHQKVVTSNAAIGDAFEILFVNALLHLGVPASDIFPKHNNSICAELDVVIKYGSRLTGVFLKTSSRERWKQVRGDSICYHFNVNKVKTDLLDAHKGQSLDLWSVSFMEHFSKKRSIEKIERTELANPIDDIALARSHAPSYFGIDLNRVCSIFDAVRIADLERSIVQASPAWAHNPHYVFTEILEHVSVSSRQIQLMKQSARIS